MTDPRLTGPRTIQIGILLYPDVEVLDFAGPYEVFTTASRMALRASPHALPPFAVCTVCAAFRPNERADDPNPAVSATPVPAGGRVGQPISHRLVRARAGLQVWADHGLDDHPPLDLLVVPGGVVDAELRQADTLAWLRRQAQAAELVASVCTGAFLLAAAGLLPDGLSVTTHWEDADDLRAAHPQLQVLPERRYIDHGARITSAGISAGIDMSLHLVSRLHSLALAERTARQMDVVWTRERE